MTSVNSPEPFVAPARTKTRDVKTALRLNSLSPGLGHIYAGKFVHGLWLTAANHLIFAMLAIAIYLWPMYLWEALVVSGIVYLGLWLWSKIDVTRITRSTRPDYRLKDYNRPSVYALLGIVPLVILAIGLALILRSSSGAAIKPAVDQGSIDIYVGDLILTSKQAYRRKLPDKRDVIYFRMSPVKGSTAVGCVAGVPGDTVATPAGAVKVPAESLWVVGHDPKEPTRGVMISAYAIIGKVTYRVWPLRRVGEILPIEA